MTGADVVAGINRALDGIGCAGAAGATFAPDLTMRFVVAARERLNRHRPCSGCDGTGVHPIYCHRCAQHYPCDEVQADMAVLGMRDDEGDDDA